MSDLSGIIRLLKQEQERVSRELRGITAALAVFGTTYARVTRPRKLSAAARARIADAQRKRWAKTRKSATPRPVKVQAVGAKRTISAAGRNRIAAAQRARWAKIRAAKKKP
jgi:hypothetical protein